MKFTFEEWKFIKDVVESSEEQATKHGAKMRVDDKEIETKWSYFEDIGELLPSSTYADEEIERDKIASYGATKTILRISREILRKLREETL
jgi:hypothetical protein